MNAFRNYLNKNVSDVAKDFGKAGKYFGKRAMRPLPLVLAGAFYLGAEALQAQGCPPCYQSIADSTPSQTFTLGYIWKTDTDFSNVITPRAGDPNAQQPNLIKFLFAPSNGDVSPDFPECPGDGNVFYLTKVDINGNQLKWRTQSTNAPGVTRAVQVQDWECVVETLLAKPYSTIGTGIGRMLQKSDAGLYTLQPSEGQPQPLPPSGQ